MMFGCFSAHALANNTKEMEKIRFFMLINTTVFFEEGHKNDVFVFFLSSFCQLEGIS